MSRSDQAECRALLMGETDAAICVCKDRQSENFWFPRSQIGYMRKDNAPDGSVNVVFTCPEWLVEKKQAWGLVP